jgi:hypothetical protein
VLAERWLADAQSFGDQQPANSINDKVAVDLLAEVGTRVLQPFQYLQPALDVRERRRVVGEKRRKAEAKLRDPLVAPTASATSPGSAATA